MIWTLVLGEGAKKLFICCPLQENSYAGWLFQVQNYAERNQSKADIHFIFDGGPQETSGIGKAWRFARHARNVIRSSLGDRIVLFPSFFFPNMLAALLLPRRIPYVVRISGGELTPGNPLVFRLRMALLRRARAIIVLNADAADKLARLHVQRAILVPNAVSEAFRPPTDEERREAKRIFGLSTDAVIIGHVGTLCKRKQQHLLVSAAARCSTEKVELLLCGPYSGHPEADPNYFRSCLKSAKAAGVHLVATGRHDDIRQAFWAMDIFGFPSVREGMPNALLEAVACGLPCVATDIAGCRDILQSYHCGFLIPLDASKNFVERIQLLVEDRKERANLLEAAYTHDEINFKPILMDEAYNKILGLHV